MTAFRPTNVLCPVKLADDEDIETARALVEQAADTAAAFGAQVTLLHVAPPDAPPIPRAEPTRAAADAMAEVLHRKLSRAHRGLAELERVVTARGLDVRSLLIAEARPVAEIVVEAAVHEGCDLIVLGDSGRHGLRHAVLGGVAERVAHGSKVPVLVLHTGRPVHAPLPPG